MRICMLSLLLSLKILLIFQLTQTIRFRSYKSGGSGCIGPQTINGKIKKLQIQFIATIFIASVTDAFEYSNGIDWHATQIKNGSS